MMLSDVHLKQLAMEYELVSPFDENSCEGASINLTLDKQIKKKASDSVFVMGNPQDDIEYTTYDLTEDEFYLQPNESILVQATEYFNIPSNMAAMILERYSIKLLGIVVSPASYMNPGYQGRLSFLMTNHSNSPIKLLAGIKFCQLTLHELSTEANKPYSKQDGRYMGSVDVHISKLHLDTDIQQFLKDNDIAIISESDSKRLSTAIMNRVNDNAKKFADILRSEIGEFKHGSVT